MNRPLGFTINLVYASLEHQGHRRGGGRWGLTFLLTYSLPPNNNGKTIVGLCTRSIVELPLHVFTLNPGYLVYKQHLVSQDAISKSFEKYTNSHCSSFYQIIVLQQTNKLYCKHTCAIVKNICRIKFRYPI